MARRKKKHDIAWHKKKLWGIFTKYIKLRENYQCFTCGKFATGQGMGGGHFISKAACPPTLYFHEDNVHAQCTECNLHLEGNHYIYGVRLGKRRVNALYSLKNKLVGEVWSIEDYKKKIEEYERKLKDIQ